jgi:hypothetical protein
MLPSFIALKPHFRLQTSNLKPQISNLKLQTSIALNFSLQSSIALKTEFRLVFKVIILHRSEDSREPSKLSHFEHSTFTHSSLESYYVPELWSFVYFSLETYHVPYLQHSLSCASHFCLQHSLSTSILIALNTHFSLQSYHIAEDWTMTLLFTLERYHVPGHWPKISVNLERQHVT